MNIQKDRQRRWSDPVSPVRGMAAGGFPLQPSGREALEALHPTLPPLLAVACWAGRIEPTVHKRNEYKSTAAEEIPTQASNLLPTVTSSC